MASPNILICDDDPVVHESLALYLDNDNFAHAEKKHWRWYPRLTLT